MCLDSVLHVSPAYRLLTHVGEDTFITKNARLQLVAPAECHQWQLSHPHCVLVPTLHPSDPIPSTQLFHKIRPPNNSTLFQGINASQKMTTAYPGHSRPAFVCLVCSLQQELNVIWTCVGDLFLTSGHFPNRRNRRHTACISRTHHYSNRTLSAAV